MTIDYIRMFRHLVEERERWVRQRDDAERELGRLSELIRATIKMLPPDQRSQCDFLFERLDNRPPGLTTAIRLCFTQGKEWLTPVEIRNLLPGFLFENYKANPLTSIHTTLKRMVPHEVECMKREDGQKVYRLKTADQWMSALSEVREWMKNNKNRAAALSKNSPLLEVGMQRQPGRKRSATRNRGDGDE